MADAARPGDDRGALGAMAVAVHAAGAVPAGLRESYLDSLPEPQELYLEQFVAVGDAYLLGNAADPVGYAVVAGDAIVEFHLRSEGWATMPALFEAVIRASGASRALCKTFDAAMMTAAASRPATTSTVGFLFRDVRDVRDACDVGAVAGESEGGQLLDLRARLGTVDDLEDVWSMHDGFFTDRAEVTAYAADGRLVLYESGAGELVGCGIMTRVIPGRDAVDVGMVVAAPHRRRGVGAHIVRDLMRRCVAAGDRPICGCSADNWGSRRALENAGFITAHSVVEFAYDI